MGVEKPLLDISGRTCIDRVLDALQGAKGIGEVVVSVSPNTPGTRELAIKRGVRVIDTGGEDFVSDLHHSLRGMDGEMVMVCPSDLPLLKSVTIEAFLGAYELTGGESFLAMVPESKVLDLGVRPSYVWELPEGRFVVSGLSIIDRGLTLKDKYLDERFYLNGGEDLAVNVNTPEELEIVRRMT